MTKRHANTIIAGIFVILLFQFIGTVLVLHGQDQAHKDFLALRNLLVDGSADAASSHRTGGAYLTPGFGNFDVGTVKMPMAPVVEKRTVLSEPDIRNARTGTLLRTEPTKQATVQLDKRAAGSPE